MRWPRKCSPQVLEVRRRALGEEHPYTLNTVFELARAYERQGRFPDAEQLHARVAEIRRRVLGAQNPFTVDALRALGRTRLEQRRYTDAEAALRESLQGAEKSAPDTWQRFEAQSALGASLSGQRRYEEAEPLLLAGYQGMLQRKSTIPAEDQSALDQGRTRLAELYEDWGKPDQAAKWRQVANQSTAANMPHQ